METDRVTRASTFFLSMPVPYRTHETKSVVPCQDRSERRPHAVSGTYRQQDVMSNIVCKLLLGRIHGHKAGRHRSQHVPWGLCWRPLSGRSAVLRGPAVVNALVDSHGNVALRALESRVLTHHSFHMAGDRKRTAGRRTLSGYPHLYCRWDGGPHGSDLCARLQTKPFSRLLVLVQAQVQVQALVQAILQSGTEYGR